MSYADWPRETGAGFFQALSRVNERFAAASTEALRPRLEILEVRLHDREHAASEAAQPL